MITNLTATPARHAQNKAKNATFGKLIIDKEAVERVYDTFPDLPKYMGYDSKESVMKDFDKEEKKLKPLSHLLDNAGIDVRLSGSADGFKCDVLRKDGDEKPIASYYTAHLDVEDKPGVLLSTTLAHGFAHALIEFPKKAIDGANYKLSM